MALRSALGTAIILACMIAVQSAVLDAAVQTIKLVDQNGTRFTFEDLRGTPVVLTFVSAHCDDACPLIEAQIAQTVHDLGRSPRAVRFLTVTLDPERDSARDMRRIASEFNATPPRWIVASGPSMDVHMLMHRYNVETQRDARGYATSHTSFVYVLDSNLIARRTLFASSDLGEQLFKEVTQ